MSTIRNRRRLGASLAAIAATGTLLGLGQAAPAAAQAGEILYANAPNAIGGSYIVVYKQKLEKVQRNELTDELATEHKVKIKHRFETALNGFAGEMTEKEAKRLAHDPRVEFVEQDRTVSLQMTQLPTPSWGLDRIDQRNLPLNNRYSYNTGASNVRAYIIDTGIRTTHRDFGGRATWGTNTTGDGTNTDCNGHGTHVAGTVGGTSYGVAKGVQLVAVKVLTCAGSGSFGGVAAGVDWITAQHQPGQPAVANMSLGAAGSDAATETAVASSIADGIVYAIASGNSNDDACNYTPARVPEAITVNATTSTDARASFSNFGTCTDVFAPGQKITSDWITSDAAINTISGTSMATPHVAGAAALVLAGNPTATPAFVADKLLGDSTGNKVTNPGAGSPNRLLYTGTATR